MTPSSGDQDIIVLRGARTPFGDFGGALKDLGAVDLGVHAARAALERGGVAPDHVEHAVFGCVLQGSGEDAYLARHVALKAGCPIGGPGLTVNRLCGSGLQAVVTAAQMIRLGGGGGGVGGGARGAAGPAGR